MTEVSESPELPVPEKKKKSKKRPSDFEIVRTILTRTHERKLPYLLRNMGEDPDILFLCSENEQGFTYGSPDLSIAIIQIEDPDLQAIVSPVLGKIHGWQNTAETQRIINLRDQISELAKTKGETIDAAAQSDSYGSVWCTKQDARGQERTIYFVKAIESLYHVQVIQLYCEQYRPLLTTVDSTFLYYPYRHPDSDTASIVTLPPCEDRSHMLFKLYSQGFRTMVTRGVDVLIDKTLEEFPYPVVQEEFIVFRNQAAACQIAHRIIAQGWRMVVLRPNAIFFPTDNIPLPQVGIHSL